MPDQEQLRDIVFSLMDLREMSQMCRALKVINVRREEY